MTEYAYIDQCISIVPEHCNHIFNPDINHYYFESFYKDIYETIARLPFVFQLQMYKTHNPTNVIGQSDNFITFKINQTESVEILGQTNYVCNESLPWNFNLLDDGLLCDFIDATSLEEKLIASPSRYLAFEVDFVSQLKNSGHSVCICFDKHKRTCFLIDSNGSLGYFDNPAFGFSNYKNLIHFTMEFYCGLLGYEYIKLSNCNINICY